MAVAFYWIVEHLNKIGYLALSFFTGCVDFSLNNLLFKCSKEAFSNGVIVAVSDLLPKRLPDLVRVFLV